MRSAESPVRTPCCARGNSDGRKYGKSITRIPGTSHTKSGNSDILLRRHRGSCDCYRDSQRRVRVVNGELADTFRVTRYAAPLLCLAASTAVADRGALNPVVRQETIDRHILQSSVDLLLPQHTSSR
jgi:hypothetical protein